jgi:uncharacterized protein YegP (UPF0339 family)
MGAWAEHVHHFVVLHDGDAWRWQFVAPDRTILAISADSYETRVEAEESIIRLKEFAVLAPIGELERS